MLDRPVVHVVVLAELSSDRFHVLNQHEAMAQEAHERLRWRDAMDADPAERSLLEEEVVNDVPFKLVEVRIAALETKRSTLKG